MLKIPQSITVAETKLPIQLSDKCPFHKLNRVKQTWLKPCMLNVARI